MMSELHAFYLTKEEPVGSYLQALRSYILSLDSEISESWTHKMPMFRYKGKLFCYLWVDKVTYCPYLGMYDGIHLNHPRLELGNRNKMKTITFDPEIDMPMDDLKEIFDEAFEYRRSI